MKGAWQRLLCIVALFPVFLNCGGANDSQLGSLSGAIEFSDMTVLSVTHDSAVIEFVTDPEATCLIRYGLANDDLKYSAIDPTMDLTDPYSVDHSVPLVRLSAETTYYFSAMATDREGNTVSSETMSFTTTTAPTVGTGSELNIALSSQGTTIASVSSSFGGTQQASSWGALNAIDGSLATEWSSQGDGNDAFIELDFGQLRTISKFGFRSRQMADGSAIIQQVRLVLPGDSDELGVFDTPDPTTMYEFEIDLASTRRIRLEVLRSTGGNVGAKEIQFFE